MRPGPWKRAKLSSSCAAAGTALCYQTEEPMKAFAEGVSGYLTPRHSGRAHLNAARAMEAGQVVLFLRRSGDSALLTISNSLSQPFAEGVSGYLTPRHSGRAHLRQNFAQQPPQLL